jgi:hypothetical protein
MKWISKGALAVAGVTAGVVARKVMQARGASHWPSVGMDHQPRQRWHVVTINQPPERVAPQNRPPEPLAKLGDMVEVQIRPAPADRGTELAARLRSGEPSGAGSVAGRLTGSDPRLELRAALRKAKQLAETGEVLSPDKPPTTKRTVRGLPVEQATRRARGEGRL